MNADTGERPEILQATTSVPHDARFSLTRLVSTTGLLGVALIVAATGYIAWTERQRLFADAAARADGSASFLADHAGRLFEVMDVALINTTAAVANQSWDAIAASQDLQKSLVLIAKTLPYVDDIWLNDAAGLLRLTSFAWPTPYSDASDRPVFHDVRAQNPGLIIGELIVGRVTQRLTFLAARRLDDASGAFRGMVSATAEVAYFDDYWRGLHLPYDARIALIRREGAGVLASYPTAPSAVKPDVLQVLATPSLPATFRSISATEIASYHRVGDFPLLLGVAFSTKAVDALWRRRLASLLPISAAAIAAMGAMTLIAFRQTRRDMQAAAAVEQARGELARVNAGLETAVAQRTAELREASEEVQRFAHLMSHDLRAPLLNVLGFAGELEDLAGEALAADTPLQSAQREELAGEISEAVSFIRAGATKMDRMLGHMLRLAREGRRTLHIEPVDMTLLLSAIVDTLRFQAEQAGALIDIGRLPGLQTDRLAMEQVFGNLLDNAIKYLDPDRPGRIAVTGRAAGSRARFEVRDNGRGINPGDYERVFELFRRAGAQDQPGEGIGLAYVRIIVRQLGGHIDLRSAIGEGTTVIVTLPLRTEVSSDTSH